MNPADQAQIEQAKFNAAQARKDAGNLMTSASENARIFTSQAEQKLAEGMTILAKTGNLNADGTSTMPVAGLGLGALDTPEVAALRSSVGDLQKQLDATPQTIAKNRDNGIPFTEGNPEYTKLKDQLAKVNEQLGILGPAGGGVADIKNPDALLHASGSDLLTMVTTRDAMERDKRTLIRNAQSEAFKALEAGTNYDKMAEYAQQAANWNTWSTILGTGLKLAGMAAGFGWFQPAAAAATVLI